MRVYVPSRGRAGVISDTVSTCTYVKEATYVVPPDEMARYERVLNYKRGTFEVLPCPEEGIAAVRRWIGQQAAKRGEDRFLMCDDDLMFAVRKSAQAYNLRPCELTDVLNMLEWTRAALDEYAHASVSPRQANNNIASGARDECVKYNKRTLRYLAYQTDKFLAMQHGRVPVMEDFDVNLQLLRAGHQNIVTYWWANDQRGTGSAGGCSLYRNEANHDAAARELARLHAPFVTLRTKVNKTGKLRERTEVTIQWEKAYQSSQAGAS